MRVRVTGILAEEGKVLMINQKIMTSGLDWGLPGGSLKNGELVDEGLKRELLEETGLEIEIERLLYVRNRIQNDETVVELVFEIKRIGGQLKVPADAQDNETEFIKKIAMVALDDFEKIGFSKKYAEIIRRNFPESGTYIGTKKYEELVG